MTSPIFIIGCERSGTTLLRAMLNNHPNIAIPYEAGQFSNMVSFACPWSKRLSKDAATSMIREILNHPKVHLWNIEETQVLKELGQQADEFSYGDVLSAIYMTYARREGKSRWGDKTPVNTFDLPEIIKAFPTAKFIHIVRDGRDVYLSWAKAEWARHGLRKAARKWKGWVWSAYRHGERLGHRHYLLIRYEDLVREPHRELLRICEFLGEPFFETMLSYYEKGDIIPERDRSFHQLLTRPPETSRIFAWKRTLTQEERNDFEKIAGSILLRYGYEVSETVYWRAQFSLLLQRIKDLAIPDWARDLWKKLSRRLVTA